MSPSWWLPSLGSPTVEAGFSLLPAPWIQECSNAGSHTLAREQLASCELESSCLLCQGYFELYIVWSGVEVTSINDQRPYFVGFHSALKCEEEWPEEWESFQTLHQTNLPEHQSPNEFCQFCLCQECKIERPASQDRKAQHRRFGKCDLLTIFGFEFQ